MLPDRLRNAAVVAVNEYDPIRAAVVGHVNVTFFWHGVDQGTYGYNIAGNDAAGHVHRRGPYGLTMPGGTFIEGHVGAYTHYVIVSEKNYYAMLTLAKAKAQQTVAHPQSFTLANRNCVDFVYQLFLVTDLTPDQKDIFQYIDQHWIPVSAYAEGSQGYYRRQALILDTRKKETSATAATRR